MSIFISCIARYMQTVKVIIAGYLKQMALNYGKSVLSFFKCILVIIFLINLISCATIINGSTEKVEVLSNISDTDIYANNVLVGKAGPDSALEVTIPKKGRVEFVGKKTNCDDAEKVVRRSIDPTTFLGLLIDGGLISILFVDIIGTNAFVRADQRSYFLELNCSM